MTGLSQHCQVSVNRRGRGTFFLEFFSLLWDTTTPLMWLWFFGSMEVVSEGDYCIRLKKSGHVLKEILNPLGNKLNEKYMQHGSPRCYTMLCVKIPSTARQLPQKHRRLKYSMLPISNWPGSVLFSNQKWLGHTNHNMTHDIHTRVFCVRCGPYFLRCEKTTATTLVM